ncbi:MAG: DUF4148 domain-containing protein [Comamonas sp.]
MHPIRRSASILILSLTAAAAGHALAAEPAGLTRAQVLQPQQYPAQQSAAGKTRPQVLAELAQARAKGELTEGEADLRQNQLRPDLYPSQAAQDQAVTSDQVFAEMQRARAAGQLHFTEGN